MSFQLFEYSFTAMGTRCTLSLYAPEKYVDKIVHDAIGEVVRLEKKYSKFSSDSLLSKINASAGSGKRFCVDQETCAIINFAKAAFEISDGLFDVTSYHLSNLWFKGNGAHPLQEDIDRALELTGFDKLDWNGDSLFLLEGAGIDLGGVVKEYAADAVASNLKKQQIDIALINLGGDVLVTGPHPNGKPWEVTIKDPNGPSALKTLYVDSGAVATSGDYERYIEIDGQKYGHIICPKSGKPVSELSQVTVKAEQLVVGGILSTSAMAKGEKGKSWLLDMSVPNITVDINGQVTCNGL